MVKFVSYTGSYPTLCSGILKIKVGNKVYELENILWSGGSVSFTEDYEEVVTYGEWRIFKGRLPAEIQELSEEITECVNRNVSKGCCGGCV